MGTIKLPKNSIDFFKNNQNKIFDSGNLAEGPWNAQLSEKIKSICNVKNAICVNSNGSGLVALLLIYKEYYGRTNVMIQSNTMYGVKIITKTAGYNLVDIIDCHLETLMPTFEDLKKSVDNYKGKINQLVILLSDIGGTINPNIEKIAKFCKEKNIILLEDAAHSFGSSLNKKFSGTFGNAGVYSYYATKAIFAGEGGIVVTNDNNIGSLMKDFIAYDRFKQKMEIGCNIRLPELQALMIYSVVKEYKGIIKNKFKIYGLLANFFLCVYLFALGRDGSFYEISRRLAIIFYIANIYINHTYLIKILRLLKSKKALDVIKFIKESKCHKTLGKCNEYLQ